jgi:hypothetical protein
MAKRRSGHFCWSCSRSRPSELFSGRGHARHVCRDCSKLGKAELDYRQAIRNVDRGLHSPHGTSPRDRTFLEQAFRHPNPRVQLYVAELVYAGERERAQWRLADVQAMHDFGRGKYIEPTVEQLEPFAATGESPWPT